MAHRLIEILEIKHIRNKQVIWQNFNLKNVLHSQGEDYFLKILFSNIISKPEFYYFGLDNRSAISYSDILTDVEEPMVNNYSRQVANSIDDWTFDISNGDNRAKSPILTFGAHGGSWGPIRNLFLTMQPQETSNENGYLISSVYLGNSSIIVADGDSISMRMAATLKNCSV